MKNVKCLSTHALLKLLALGVFMLLALQVRADVTSPGVYIQSEKGYVALPALEGMDGLGYDFSRHLLNLPVVQGDELTLVLLVNSKDFSPEWAEYELRTVESPAAGVRISPRIEKSGDDKHQLTFTFKDRSQHFLLIDIGCCRNEQVYGIALTDTREAIARVFSDTSLNPVSVEHVLAGILRGAPDDSKVKALHQQWQGRIDAQQAEELFVHIKSAWSDYEQAKDTAAKVDALQSVQAMSERYLEEFAAGKDKVAVTEYLQSAKKKLEI
jgi:hypothetical protein